MTSPTSPDVLDRAWDVSARVSVRPESFGALLYHFGTRRLSFLKDRKLLEVIQRLPDSTTARDACVAAGITYDELVPYGRALLKLADTDMLKERL